MVDVVFHIGLHKTATTTLQKDLFPACSGINHLTGQRPAAFVSRVTTGDPAYISGEELRHGLYPSLDDERVNLLSDEALSGALYSGVGKRGLDHRTPIIYNLRSAFPEARLVVVIRRQDELAKSIYRQYLKFGGTEPAARFFGVQSAGEGIFPTDRFIFSPYLAALKDAFSKGVLILVYEEFVHDPRSFLEKLCGFLGVSPPEVSLGRSNSTNLGARGMEATRIANRFFRNQLNPAGLLPGIPRRRQSGWEWVSPVRVIHDRWPGRARIDVKNDVFGKLFESCRHDNRRTDGLFGLGLKKYGYF